MTAHAPLLRLLPFLLLLALAALTFLLSFNGLYGQDAHEYLRQSRAIFEQWQTGRTVASPLDHAEFALGYPIAGALVRWCTGDALVALQLVSWISYALSVWLLERILSLLAHGSRADSRLLFVVLGLALSPVMVRAGLTVMSDAPGLALLLAAMYFALRWIEYERGSDTVWAAFFAVLAISVRVGLAGMLLPLAVATGWWLIQRRRWRWLVAATATGLAILWLHVRQHPDVLAAPWQHSMFQHWSLTHFWQRSFSNENGWVRYLLPNGLYCLFPLWHPGFSLMLPGLWLLAKKTDWMLPAKQAVLACLLGYLLLLGGLPHQNLRFLLPAYALVLLLLFPAWDRMYCYGLYFFRRLTVGLLLTSAVVSVAANVWLFRSVLTRNRSEVALAAQAQAVLPPDAVVYAFDVDIALQSYLPAVRFRNMWRTRYGVFQPGAYVIFNEPALRTQWAGQNPMLNWQDLQNGYTLRQVSTGVDGWGIWKIE
jgi:4-amino-4-deoxy-L-arabinose transferase-like glycosyltransferase